MAAKHHTNPWEHVLVPSDFTKHWKLTFATPNFNSGYDNWSSKPPFAPRSLSGDLLDFGFWILASGSWILDLGSWILDLGSWILDYEL